MTLFLAGHETTSHALTWAWYLLAQNPGAEQKLHKELDQVLAGGTPGLDDLPTLPYTELVIKEAMRLYPPAYVLARRVRCDTETGGYQVPAGSEVVIWIYMIHHDARWYPNPDAMPNFPSSLIYIFGAGPRSRIGTEFAML